MTTKEAFDTLKQAINADSDYAWGWQCNIAMAIYDESRPQCYCALGDEEWTGHKPDCSIVRAHDARHFEEHRLSSAFCNNAAARFMKLCFDVDVTQSPQWKSLNSMGGRVELIRGQQRSGSGEVTAIMVAPAQKGDE